MNDFIELIKDNTVSTVEGLLGIAPEIDLKEAEDLQENATIVPPAAVIDIDVSGDTSAKIEAIIPPSVATALGDMMMGGDGEQREDMTEEDLDAI